jgi:hypothetical protein
MPSRSVAVAAVLSVLSLCAAAGCYFRAGQLQGEARWLLQRGAAEGAEYAATFENVHAEAQLVTLAERRVVLESVHLWQRLQYLLVLLAVLFAVASYALFLFHRLESSLESVESPAG